MSDEFLAYFDPMEGAGGRDELPTLAEEIDAISLEEAGLEEYRDEGMHCDGSCPRIVEWFSDGEDSRWEQN